MADKIRPAEQMLGLTDEEAVSAEHLDNQVQKAQEQLLQLKRQQLEQSKQELELKVEQMERQRAKERKEIERAVGAGKDKAAALDEIKRIYGIA